MSLPLLNDMKPLGAFIENTIRPLLSELKESGIDIKVVNLEKTLFNLGLTHIFTTFINALRDIIVVCIITYICMTLQS